MAELAGPLVSVLLARVRDPGAGATSRDQARDILSRCQQVINGAIGTVVSSDPLTLESYRQIYPIAGALPNALRVIGVEHQGRSLTPAPYNSLAQTDSAWFRKQDYRPEVFALPGRDTLVVHPAVDTDDTVTVKSIAVTAVLVDDATPTDMPDEDLPVVLDLAQIILLLRMRHFQAMIGSDKEASQASPISMVGRLKADIEDRRMTQEGPR